MRPATNHVILSIAVLAALVLASCSSSDLIDGRPDWCPGRADMTPITAERCAEIAAACLTGLMCRGFEGGPGLRNCPVECPAWEAKCKQQCLTQRFPRLVPKP